MDREEKRGALDGGLKIPCGRLVAVVDGQSSTSSRRFSMRIGLGESGGRNNGMRSNRAANGCTAAWR